MADETILYLVRHAKSAPDPSVPEPMWPLSEEGRRQAEALRDRLRAIAFDRICSSPYPRAVATVAPLAAALGLAVQAVDDLRERKLSEEMLVDWQAQLERTWRDFDYRCPGGESSRECQVRVIAALTRIARAHEGGTLLASSHGNALALALNHIDPDFGFAQWKAMRNPHVYRISIRDGSFRWDRDGESGG
jgi:2,3-bisphosphoglycerate-dependent phosphoglycerate mutase